MAQSQDVLVQGAPEVKRRNTLAAGIIIGSHSLQHMYHSGFLIVLPKLYGALGLTPIQAGLIGTMQRLGGGVASMGGGVVVDQLQHWRGPFLGASLALMGLGYMLVGFSPTYFVVLVALAFASAAGSLWHPPALGLLSQRYPEKRGLLISLHRASGTVGESVAPILVGVLLIAITWQWVLQGGFLMALVAALVIWALLWNVGGPRQPKEGTQARGFKAQFRALGQVMKQPGLPLLFLLAGLRGMGDNALFFWLSLYLTEELHMSTAASGVHLTLLTALAILFGPLWGELSDRWGRKPVMVTIMAISATLAGLMVLAEGGPALTALVVLMGTVMFSVNSLVQATAMDLAEGRRLEGSLIGLLWGNNALFGALSPILVGTLVGLFGFKVIFMYATALYLVGVAVALALPRLGARRSAPVGS